MAKKNTNLTIFLTIIALLILIGMVFIYSSSSVFALEKFGSPHYFVKKQLMGLALGLCGLFFFMLIPLALIQRCAPLFFFSSLLLTALTLVPGFSTTIHGSHRWLNLGGFTFQPSELLKISLILYFAYFLAKKQYHLSSFTRTYLPFLCILGLTSCILLAQPDFGQTITLCTTALLLFFIAQCQTKHLLITLIPLIPITGLLIYLKPYRLKRILTFLNPWDDPQGAGFQIIQSLIAIGSGSIGGVGIAQSKQKFFYLPMQHTDFIFSIIAEETGFIGSSILIFLYMLLLYIGIRIAWSLNNVFCIFTVLGFVILTSLQTIINLFVVTGLMPTKGIGLPFVSYGNSALICGLCMVGIVINCVQEDSL